MNTSCKIYIVRHGESEANRDNLNQGHLDSPLSKRGEEQALKTKRLLNDIEFCAIYSSDLKRTVRTAELIRNNKSLQIQTSSELRERNFGSLEGLPKDEYARIIETELIKFNQQSDNQKWFYSIHPEIETDIEVLERFYNYILAVAKKCKDANILIVSHRGPTRLLLSKLGEIPYGSVESKRALDNTGYIELEYKDEKLDVIGIHKLIES